MAEYREYISALKQCAEEHENENLFTGQIDTTALCNDTAKLLENDVIERSKVHKAIEEIEGGYSTCNQDWIDGINWALDIFKRNIGE